MTTARVLSFPLRPIFRAMHAFHIEQGRGNVVAVFFAMPVNGHRDPAGHCNKGGGNDQAQLAVVEAGP